MHVAQVHTNYQCSMILEDIIGITNLNGHTNLHQAGMNTTLNFTFCQVLLSYVCLSDGPQLLAKVHQSNNVMGCVQAVIPTAPEAEQMILMMNKRKTLILAMSSEIKVCPMIFCWSCLCSPAAQP
jgi:hypothetical protein